MTIGMVAATARSLAVSGPHRSQSRQARGQFVGLCLQEIASASHPAAACNIGAAPAPAISRAVLSSGGIACQNRRDRYGDSATSLDSTQMWT